MYINEVTLLGVANTPVSNHAYKNGNGSYGSFFMTMNSGTKETRAEILLYGDKAKEAGAKIMAGSIVLVKGRIGSGSYQGRDGQQRLSYSIIGNMIEVEGSKTATDSLDNPALPF